ncbi:hypothetical protein H0E87_000270 [Populus deltoides]|uniref:Uncharacterized protein n=1 Tax=Populus deltoides TaxID=3696 RepID=A0A8T2ZLV3_POPDE|nr:hypothetical protein H0E87_000270 [Populus deltoides]
MVSCRKSENEVEKRDERKEEKYCRGGDYKGLRALRPLWSPSNWSDDKNMTPWQRLDKCGRFWRTLSRNIPSSRRFAKDEDLWGGEEAALGSLEAKLKGALHDDKSLCKHSLLSCGVDILLSIWHLTYVSKNPPKLLAVFVMRKTHLCTLLNNKELTAQ